MDEIILDVVHARINQGWLIIDRDYRVVYANETICRWLSQDSSRFIGKSLLDVLYRGRKRSHCGEYYGPLIETMDTGIEQNRKECYMAVSGQYRWFLANTFLITNEHGQTQFAVGNYVIIDKYKSIEETLDTINLSIIKAFVEAIGARDHYTKTHSECVADLMMELAQFIGLTPSQVRRAYLTGLVHDIGKIGIPEHILNKPGRLTVEEFAVIQEHPGIGANILSKINGFNDISKAVRHHHERFDGQGYPDRMGGCDIPLFSRMLAVCDTFDAMISARCYRQPFSYEQAVDEIKRCTGTQFDPVLSDAFIEMMQFRRGNQVI